MSGNTPETPAAVEPPKVERSAVDLAYGGDSGLKTQDGDTVLALFGDLKRAPVQLNARVKDPVRLREALAALYEVVSSDFSYQPKDRTAWLAFQRMRQQSGTAANSAAARKAYFDWLLRNDPLAFILLDPLVSVFPDELSFEVFSKDEGSYARLSIQREALEIEGEPVCGTTHIDFSQALHDSVQRMRSYRPTRISVGQEAVRVTAGEASTLEKRISVPDSWLRGFLQVQSAASLPTTKVSIAPLDLYNVLRHLRLNADQKNKGRGLRVELVPGEAPRLVLEPWELVLPSHGAAYTGRRAEVLRLWGRRRLMMMRRLLPFSDSVELHLLGSGLPSFWVLRAGPITFTLGLSGFTSAAWSQSVSFDLLLPRAGRDDSDLPAVLKALAGPRVATAEALAATTGLPLARVLSALQLATQLGQVMIDLAGGVYRLRPVLAELPDLTRLEYRNDRERAAFDLLNVKGAVKVIKENHIHGEGLELIGKVVVEADKREYRPELLLMDDGRVRKATCTCAQVRQHGLKEGPCAHLIALRLQQARVEAERLANRGKSRDTITVETRTYVKRKGAAEEVFQLTLDLRKLRVRWGSRGESLRAQNLVFNTEAEARAAYFGRVDTLEARGFLDATAGGA